MDFFNFFILFYFIMPFHFILLFFIFWHVRCRRRFVLPSLIWYGSLEIKIESEREKKGICVL